MGVTAFLLYQFRRINGVRVDRLSGNVFFFFFFFVLFKKKKKKKNFFASTWLS